MSLVCTSVSGVAEGHFVVGNTYKPDSKGRITTPNPDGSLALWTVENYNIYSLVGDPESAIVATFESE